MLGPVQHHPDRPQADKGHQAAQTQDDGIGQRNAADAPSLEQTGECRYQDQAGQSGDAGPEGGTFPFLPLHHVSEIGEEHDGQEKELCRQEIGLDDQPVDRGIGVPGVGNQQERRERDQGGDAPARIIVVRILVVRPAHVEPAHRCEHEIHCDEKGRRQAGYVGDVYCHFGGKYSKFSGNVLHWTNCERRWTGCKCLWTCCERAWTAEKSEPSTFAPSFKKVINNNK